MKNGITYFVTFAILTYSFSPLANDQERRAILRDFAKTEFSGSENHCESFAKVAEKAASLSGKTTNWLEDMRLVMIGEDFVHRKNRGRFFHGVATKDTGFKPSLKDGSSQVEHAMAAIYIGKLGPAAPEVLGLAKEIWDAYKREATLNTEDLLLFSIGGDIGARLHDGELSRVGYPIRKTMCQN